VLEAQKQQHLRTLRRTLNRAVMSLKEDGQVVCYTGWGYGVLESCAWIESGGEGLPEGAGDRILLLPPPDVEEYQSWFERLPEGLTDALDFYWPGPLCLRVKHSYQVGERTEFVKMTVGCPWHPLAKELLTRHGPVFWSPLPEELALQLEEGHDLPEVDGRRPRALIWPEKESPLKTTLLDVSTRPWRLMEQGFVGYGELCSRLQERVVLSQDRAFPIRAIRRYIPEGKTIILEAEEHSQLPQAVRAMRQQVPADAFVRIYLDEAVAHNHFPDDREVRVYGELSDPERVRRRLQAMLERQSQKFGKRVLLIGVAGLGPQCESLRIDLEKLSDGWLKVEDGKELRLDV
jgi:hypothetical protein